MSDNNDDKEKDLTEIKDELLENVSGGVVFFCPRCKYSSNNYGTGSCPKGHGALQAVY